MPSVTEQAVRRLEAALQGLEQAVDDRLSRAVGADGLAEEVQMLTSDRARLAEALDQVQARAGKLETITVMYRAGSTRRSRRSERSLPPTRRSADGAGQSHRERAHLQNGL
jgi:hypothetical protein